MTIISLPPKKTKKSILGSLYQQGNWSHTRIVTLQ